MIVVNSLTHSAMCVSSVCRKCLVSCLRLRDKRYTSAKPCTSVVWVRSHVTMTSVAVSWWASWQRSHVTQRQTTWQTHHSSRTRMRRMQSTPMSHQPCTRCSTRLSCISASIDVCGLSSITWLWVLQGGPKNRTVLGLDNLSVLMGKKVCDMS